VEANFLLSGRVGPFEVVRELSHAPGAILVEARDGDGERRILQLARFRAPADEGERGRRQAQERAIARRTAELIGDPGIVVHAHGGADDDDSGERILFWALPFTDRPALEGQTLAVEDLLDVGVKLAHRLVARHEAGQVDPLLTEHLVRRDDRGSIEVIGVPLAIDRGWVAPEMQTFRAAPEENGSPSKSGDLYRLGKLLQHIAPRDLPNEVSRALDRLTAENGARYPTARAVLTALELLHAPTIPIPIATDETKPTRPTEPGAWVAPDVLSSRDIHPILGIAVLETIEHGEPFLEASEAVTHTAEPVTPIPSKTPLILEVTPHESSAVLARATIETEAPELAALDVLAASWRQPVLPAGESPWSEVVEARGAHHRAKSEFPGFPESLPLIEARPKKREPLPDIEIEDSQDLPSVPRAPLPVDQAIDEEIAAAITGFNTKKIVTGVLALLVIFGLFAAIARSGDKSRNGGSSVEMLEAPPTNELVLESDPPGATVVAESDGAILGKTPLSFLVTRGSDPNVLLTLPGHEPIKMSLPERGAVRARLMPLDVSPCRVELTALAGAKLEGVGFDIGGEDATIPGAGIVRAAEGPSRGAHLVLCPSLGGPESRVLDFAPLKGQATVRITTPAGAAAFLDGDPIGKVPTVAKAKRSFARIRVDGTSGMSEERIVPTARDVEVRMPTPKPRRLPVLVVPGDESSAPSDEVEEVRALAPSPEAAAHYKRALMAIDAGDTRTAKAEFTECLASDPNDPLCNREIAELHHRMRSPQKAREHYLRYLELAPNAPDADRIRSLLNE
jgi:hypothetical protein